MRYLLRSNTGYVTSRKEIRASVFDACWERRFRNGILSKFFVRYRLLASENDLYELANIFCNVDPGVVERVSGLARAEEVKGLHKQMEAPTFARKFFSFVYRGTFNCRSPL